MKNKFTLLLSIILLGAIFHSCNSDKTEFEKEIIKEEQVEEKSAFAGASDFAISQNYLFRIMTLALTNALLRPEMHGVQGPPQIDTRTCPTVTATTGSPNVLEIDFGTDCYFINSIGGTPDTISGLIRLEAYGPITDPSTNTFFMMDELKMNGKTIRFVAGNPTTSNWIKFQFSGNTSTSTFTYDAFIDGSVPAGNDPIFDRSQFQIIDCTSGDSLVLYPSYSGITAFNFDFIDPDDPTNPPEFTYESLVNGSYEIDVNPIVALYFDETGTLVEDYNITKEDNSPLLYRPLCKWVYGGKFNYDDIPTSNPSYSDMIDNPYLKICYGSDEFGNENNACDRFVKMTSCDIFNNNVCVAGADTTILACPL